MNTDDNEFDKRLTELYAASLLDEDFQQFVSADLKQLPFEKRALLNEKTQVFIEDKVPSDALMEAIFADIAQRIPSLPPNTKTKIPIKKKRFWRTLFSRGEHSFSLLSPAMTIPTSLAFGILLGFVFLPMLTSETSMPTDSFRGGDDSLTIRGGSRGVAQSADVQKDDFVEADGFTENQTTDLDNIASLILEGNIEEAEQLLKRFKQDYPDFKPVTE